MSVLELFVKLDVKHNVVGSVNGLKVCYLKLWFWYFQVQNVEIYVILTIPNTPDGTGRFRHKGLNVTNVRLVVGTWQ